MTLTRMTMGIYRAFALPWLVTTRSTLWVAAVVILLTGVVLILIGSWSTLPTAWMAYALMLCVATFFCWLLIIPGVLLLNRAAHQLRLPRIGHDIGHGALLYACVNIGVSVALLPTHALIVGLVLALTVAVSVGILLLPFYWTLSGWALWAALTIVPGKMSAPNWSEVDFVVASGFTVVLLAAGIVRRWRWLARADLMYIQRWRMPLGLYLGQRMDELRHTQTSFATVRSDDRRGWLVALVDLRRIGPQHPIQSLRIAIAGIYLPQLIAPRTLLIVMAALALPIALVYRSGSLAGPQFAVVVAEYMSFALAGVSIRTVQRRWAKPNAELSLLSLLPGFGSARGARRAVFHAVFGLPAKQLGMLLVVMWVAIAWGRLGYEWTLIALLAQLGWFGLLAVMLPAVVAGQPLPGWVRFLLFVAMGVLVAASLWLLGHGEAASGLWPAVAVSAVLLALILLWLGARGWRALQRQPHVFLAH